MNAIDFICLIPFYISMLLEGLEDVETQGRGAMMTFAGLRRDAQGAADTLAG